MFEVPTDEVEPGMVVQVAQTGWMLHDRLLTPAMVGVSKATEGKG
jgi:molecular chaperone GrpE